MQLIRPAVPDITTRLQRFSRPPDKASKPTLKALRTVKRIRWKTCPVILMGSSTRNDGSLTLRFSTPELEAGEKTAFMELLNLNLKMLLQPADGEPVELKEVKNQIDKKSASCCLPR